MGSTTSSQSNSQHHQRPFIKREAFWNKSWALHLREPLEFVGLPPNGKQYEITSLMKILVEAEDQFFKLISGKIPIPKSLHAAIPPIKIKMVMYVFWNNFFRDSSLKEISPSTQFDKWTIVRYYFGLSSEQKKSWRFLAQCFAWNALNFVLLNMEHSQNSQQYVVDKAEFIWSIPKVPRRKIIKLEVQFTSKYTVISDHTLKAIGHDFELLLKTNRLSQMTFRELQQNRGLLLMMHMLLQFANVGGRCGVDRPPLSAKYRQAIFWYVINIFRHGPPLPLQHCVL